MVSTFDPAAHLSKQGWKGKGTALKQGHATRPLAVVQKKTLSGIGKDRDEAVPFWDQIFAATAASIFSSPSGSGASSPIPQRAAHSTTRDWITTSYSAPVSGSSTPTQLTVKPKIGGAPSTQARIGKEMARKGLYSRFLRGKTIVVEPEDEVVAGPSTLVGVVEETSKGKGKREGETKEERRARRAEKARRKAEKAAGSTTTTERETNGQAVEPKLAKGEGKKKKRKLASEEAELEVKSEEPKAEDVTKRKKEKKRKGQAEGYAESGKETARVVSEGQGQKAERKKKRRKAEA